MDRVYWSFIKDPIYGYIRITDVERDVIDSLPVQRLRRIRQLSGAEYVYPAANHTRFEHSLGTMFLAGALAESLPVGLSEFEIQRMKLAALLHDVGHAPFSHLLEPVLMKYFNVNHETMTERIIAESELADILGKLGFDAKGLSKLAVGRLEEPNRRFLDQVIRSSIDVDKMDFLVRDSYHTGAGYGHFDVFRLIYTMDVLDDNLAVDLTALPTLEAFILARLESFRAIYFHKTSRAAQLMLLKALEAAKDEIGLMELRDLDRYLAADDASIWSALCKCGASAPVMEDLRRRRLLKCAYERTFFVEEELISSLLTNEGVRAKVREEISGEAGLSPDDVYIDVPTLPSVPYNRAMELAPMEIPLFMRGRGGKKVSKSLSEVSKVISVLRSFMNIIRIYSPEEHRDSVGRAAERVLGSPPISSVVSY
ncbi:MAG: HD domain-containing protein [Candidatus Bathyarchaeia archaeon]